MQNLKGKADIGAAAAVLGAVGTVHLFPHVGCNCLIKSSLLGRKRVCGCVGATLWEQLGSVETIQLLFCQSPHHVAHIGLVDALAKAAFKPIRIQQAHEQLKVSLLPIVGRGRHQQKIASLRAKKLAQLMALGLFNLPAKVGCSHAMRLVADDHVPLIGRL